MKSLVLIVAAAMILLPAIAMADDAKPVPPAPAEGPKFQVPPELQGSEQIIDNEAFKAEKARHEKAVQDIMAPLRPIREKLAADIKALRDQTFPVPPAGVQPTPPTPEQMKDFLDKVKALVQQAQTANEAALKNAAGKLFDEFILHHQNLLKIAQDNKAAIVDNHWKRLLIPPRLIQAIHERLQAIREHRLGPRHPGAPSPTVPAPPAPPAAGGND